MRLVGTVGNSWISASPEEPWEPLLNALRRFRACSIGLSLGLAGASVKVGIRFEWLSLPDLIKAMRLEAKKASDKGMFKWLNDIWPAQERFLSSLWSTVKSLRCRMARSAVDSEEVLDTETFRILKEPTMPARACFAIMTRWCMLDRGNGGLGATEDRGRVRLVLDALLSRCSPPLLVVLALRQ